LDPAGGAYSTPPDPLADFKGPLCSREGEGEWSRGAGRECKLEQGWAADWLRPTMDFCTHYFYCSTT